MSLHYATHARTSRESLPLLHAIYQPRGELVEQIAVNGQYELKVEVSVMLRQSVGVIIDPCAPLFLGQDEMAIPTVRLKKFFFLRCYGFHPLI